MRDDTLKLKIGVLGCGPVAQFGHFDAIHKARNAELYAICDLANDLREKMNAVWEPTTAYDDYDRMLDDPRLEAVVIAVADQFHVTLAIQAMKAGKHVLVEKPMGVDIEECESLREQVAARDLVLQVGNNRRFDPGVAFAKQFIDEELGGRLDLKAWYHDSSHRYTMTDNLQTPVRQSPQALRPEGNPKQDRQRYYILGHASHLVDTARYLGGEIEAVHARLLQRFDAWCWYVEVDFADGSLGHLDLIVAIHGDFEEGFVIHGEHGSVKGHLYLPWFHKSGVVECFSNRDRVFRRPLGEDAYSYKLQIEGFADTILHGKPQHGAGVDDGLAAMRLMVAIARSGERREKVRVAELKGTV
jgi:predicted dehydrogenase